MRDNGPDPHEHRNGTAPAGLPPAEAYPAEWLSQADLRPPTGGLGGEGFDQQEGCVMAFDSSIIKGEQGAIAMDAVRVTKMSFKVTCYSFSPPRVQLDETGAQQAMTEVVPPAGKDAGTYEDTVAFTSEGPHHIICFNGTPDPREGVCRRLPCLARHQGG